MASVISLTPLALARLLDDVHALAKLARKVTPEIDSTLATMRELSETAREALPKLDELNRHFAGVVPEAERLNDALEGAIPQAAALNAHFETAVPLLAALEPSIRQGIDLMVPLGGEIERLGRVLDRLQLADRIGPLVERLSRRPTEPPSRD